MRSMMVSQNPSTLFKFPAKGSNRVATAATRRLNFTKKAIDGLPSPTAMGLSVARHVYFRDSQVRGLCLRVSSTGGKVFVSYRKIAGRPERIVLGKYPDLTIQQARGMASKNNSVIATGGNPADSKRDIRDEMTLKELFAQFGEYYGQQKRTWSEMERQFNVYLHKWHLRRISSITKLDVVALHAALGRERGPYTANRTIELLCSMFNRAIEWGWPHENPAARIGANKEIKRERFLLPEELPQFFRALDAEPNKDIRDYIYLSLFTGGAPLECRGHELAADQLQSCPLEHPRGPGEGGRGAHDRIATGSFGDTQAAKADGHQRMGVPWNRCHRTPGGTQKVLASRP